jgi:hypothetical protein
VSGDEGGSAQFKTVRTPSQIKYPGIFRWTLRI